MMMACIGGEEEEKAKEDGLGGGQKHEEGLERRRLGKMHTVHTDKC